MSNKTVSIYAIDVPVVSCKFVQSVQRVFPPLVVTPQTSIEDVMWSAGEQRVIAYLISQAKSSTVSGDALELRQNKQLDKGILNTLLGDA